jgi:hypothetical protein
VRSTGAYSPLPPRASPSPRALRRRAHGGTGTARPPQESTPIPQSSHPWAEGCSLPPAQAPPGASVAIQGRDAAVLADDNTLRPADGKRPHLVPLKDLQDLLVPLARGCGLPPLLTEEAPPMTGPWPRAILQQGLLGSRERREPQGRRRALPARCMVRAVHVKSPQPPVGEDP